MYAERQGYHLPAPPTQHWASGSPLDGVSEPGVAFYSTSFELNMPSGYDIPLNFVFPDISTANSYRCQLFVNGYQFGKYIHNLGPQTWFPVPEGILNYHGINYLALSLWALEEGGAKLDSFSLEPSAIIETGYGPVELSPMPAWAPRPNAY
jgi:hypothetical protein